jgi:hypothetical protein
MPLACPIQSGVALRLATALQICWTENLSWLQYWIAGSRGRRRVNVHLG